eukprot:766518-Hanusia_phi.AAC.8
MSENDLLWHWDPVMPEEHWALLRPGRCVRSSGTPVTWYRQRHSCSSPWGLAIQTRTRKMPGTSTNGEASCVTAAHKKRGAKGGKRGMLGDGIRRSVFLNQGGTRTTTLEADRFNFAS